MYGHALCMYLMPEEVRRGHHVLWNGSYRWFINYHVGSGTKPRSSARLTNALGYLTISPALKDHLKNHLKSQPCQNKPQGYFQNFKHSKSRYSLALQREM